MRTGGCSASSERGAKTDSVAAILFGAATAATKATKTRSSSPSAGFSTPTRNAARSVKHRICRAVFWKQKRPRLALHVERERFARGADRGVESRIEGARKTGEAAEDLAAGRVRLTPIKEKLVEDLVETSQTVRDRDKLKEVAKRKLDDWKQSITRWMDKRMDDQLDDAGEFTANAAIDAAIGAATGTLGRTSGELAEGAEKIGKRASGPIRLRRRSTLLGTTNIFPITPA
jgi:hypothetical protein